MSNTQSAKFSVACESVFHKWRGSHFYKEALVLGLDIGLEGIGVCVRKGSEILYAKTWAYDVPEPARLESRRQLRAARHCRANRRTRLRRLHALFEKHGLPWLANDSEVLLNSDPYVLRHRAIASANGLASAEALGMRTCRREPLAGLPPTFQSRRLHRAGLKLPDQHAAAFAFHHRHHARLPAPMHRVDLPVAHPAAFLDHRGPLSDRTLPGQPSPAVLAPILFAPLLACSSQMLPQRWRAFSS